MKVLKIIFAFLFTLVLLAIAPLAMSCFFYALMQMVLEYVKMDAQTAVATVFGLYVAWDIIKEFFKYTFGVINEKK